jgi:isocitrate dehydrogenase kinase/phosphatase
VGVDAEIEFVNTDFDTPPTPTASEPWFYIDENDVFPEEFQKF